MRNEGNRAKGERLEVYMPGYKKRGKLKPHKTLGKFENRCREAEGNGLMEGMTSACSETTWQSGSLLWNIT